MESKIDFRLYTRQYCTSLRSEWEIEMLFSLKDAMLKCPGLQQILEKAADGYQETDGGWPKSDEVRVTIILTDEGATEGKAGYASGTVKGLGKLMDQTLSADDGTEIPKDLHDPYEALSALYKTLHAVHGPVAKEALGRLHWDRYYGDFIVQRDPIPRPNRRY